MWIPEFRPQLNAQILQFASKSDQADTYRDSPITIMVTGSAAKMSRQIMHTTVVQREGRGGEEERVEKEPDEWKWKEEMERGGRDERRRG